ncbi:acyl-CoA dehydrogenase family protein [Pseudonocardia endophytica]|uniref:Acyl-CoA dehydrogenase n=1 Tax=Pseudonocardia endophytica TaxID=401976 RepID=A0A4R1HLG4_PSEEN|nr:acyl-CoA dehydrogenase family protein [Pseudonocardia endophytica]TCK22818.1 acyl-CoA dehydrogenase [Pseudonocardia endophytica]
MGWDFSTEADFQSELDWARRLMVEEVEPLETVDLPRDELERALAPLQEQVKERGLWAAHLDPELGGQGYGQLKLGLLNQQVGRSELGPFVFGSRAPDAGNAEILALNATVEQRTRYLEPLLAGRLRSAFAMTELDTACSDPTLLQLRAVPDGDGLVLNGSKWFITQADVADFFLVMVVTDPDEQPHRRASIVIVDRAQEGCHVGRAIGSMHDPVPGPSSFETHSVLTFADCRIPASQVLGEVGAGFTIAQQRLGPGRIHHCMRWIAQAERALDMLCERALYRRSHGRMLGEHQSIQNWIADSTAELHAVRLMTLHAAWRIDSEGSRAARREISMIKYYGARMLLDVLDRAIQTYGSIGYSTDMPLEAMYRAGRASRIYDGPDEVHRAVVARSVLKDYSAPEDGVPTEYVPRRREAALRRVAELLDLATT